jgi:hypothetical protein
MLMDKVRNAAAIALTLAGAGFVTYAVISTNARH